CRNVLIYFTAALKDRALQLFRDSLCKNGFLCLGTKEDIRFSGVADTFTTIGKDEKIYRKRG
ncbi:MAG: protein-glutamate O-methyltransferase CheR, partial [Deltaproteobacteria bacterium]|nr:protein-glutamate O-methyltransferase CheR [Deltaproteobacteria bacterium]